MAFVTFVGHFDHACMMYTCVYILYSYLQLFIQYTVVIQLLYSYYSLHIFSDFFNLHFFYKFSSKIH